MATSTHVEKGNVILIFLWFLNNHADLQSDLFNLNMFHLITYFAAVMLIQGTVFMCETSFSPISPLPVNLITTFHQYRRELVSHIFEEYLIIYIDLCCQLDRPVELLVMGLSNHHIGLSPKTLWLRLDVVAVAVCEGNRKALVEKSGLVKHAAGSTKAKDAQSRQALTAEQQQRNAAHRCVSPP